jgi:hypothetical protein
MFPSIMEGSQGACAVPAQSRSCYMQIASAPPDTDRSHEIMQFSIDQFALLIRYKNLLSPVSNLSHLISP